MEDPSETRTAAEGDDTMLPMAYSFQDVRKMGPRCGCECKGIDTTPSAVQGYTK